MPSYVEEDLEVYLRCHTSDTVLAIGCISYSTVQEASSVDLFLGEFKMVTLSLSVRYSRSLILVCTTST